MLLYFVTAAAVLADAKELSIFGESHICNDVANVFSVCLLVPVISFIQVLLYSSVHSALNVWLNGAIDTASVWARRISLHTNSLYTVDISNGQY